MKYIIILLCCAVLSGCATNKKVFVNPGSTAVLVPTVTLPL